MIYLALPSICIKFDAAISFVIWILLGKREDMGREIAQIYRNHKELSKSIKNF